MRARDSPNQRETPARVHVRSRKVRIGPGRDLRGGFPRIMESASTRKKNGRYRESRPLQSMQIKSRAANTKRVVKSSG